MIHRLTRTYFTATVVVLLFLSTVHLLRHSTSSDSSASASSTWRDWMWPTSAAQGNVGKATRPKFSRPDNVPPLDVVPDSYSEETTTLPALLPTTETVFITATVKAPTETSVVTSTVTKTVELDPTAAAKVKCPSNQAWRMKPLQAVNTTFTVPKDMVHSPDGPKPHEIVLVTATDGKGHNGGIEDIIGQTGRNRKEYCDYHGYNYHFVNISKFDMGNAHPVWKKIPAIVDAFNAYPKAKWVFFLDLDAIIMSPKQDLTSLVLSHEGMKKSLDFGGEWTGSERAPLGTYMQPDADLDNLDMLVAQDQNGVNAGSFFLRRSKYTQWLVDMWADPFFMKMDWAGQEQEALLHFIKHHHTFREHTGIIKQRVGNAYVEGDSAMAWQKGDLVVHLAGCWVADKCDSRWKEFWNKRETVEIRETADTTYIEDEA